MKPKTIARFAAKSSLLMTVLMAHSATAGTLYWKTSTGVFWDEATTPAWSAVPGGPYTSAWVQNSDVVFEANGGTALTIGGPDAQVDFASVTANENVTVAPFNFNLGTGGTVVPVTVAPGKTLDFSTQTLASDPGTGFIKNGTGTWIIGNSNATGYPSGFTLNAGTVAVGSVNALGSGGALTITGGTLRSNSTTARDLTGKFGGAGNITLSGDCTLGDTTNTGILTFSNPVSLGGGVRTLTVNSGVTLAAGATLTNGGIIKNGGGVLTLSDAGSYTGGFTLNAGTVTIGALAATSALGNNGPLALNGGTLTISAFTNRSLAGKFTGITIGGDPSFTGGATTDALTFDANVNLGSATRTFTVNSSSNTRFTGAGVISGAPGVGITKAGTGVLILDGSNVHTISGRISVNAGGLTIGGTAAQSFPGGIAVNGGTLTFTDSAAHTFDGGVTVNSGTLAFATTAAPSFLNKVKMNGGAITYNYANMGTPDDMIPNGTALTLEKFIGLSFSGKSNTDSSQTFGNLTINGGRQTMVITPSGTGKMTVTLSNTWTRNDNAVLHVTLNGALAFLATNPGVSNGIIGPWCTTLDSNGTRYATVSAGNVVAFTGGTAAADATALGDTGGTINYDLAAGGSAPATSVSNTIRYTGAAATLTPGTSFSTNGLLNAAGSGSVLTVAAGTLTIGANKELVVNNNLNRGITIASTIVDNGTGASGVTLVGVSANAASTTILSNTSNSFTGPATITGTNVLGDGVRTIESTGVLPAAGTNSFLGAGSKIILNGSIIQLTPAAAATTNRKIVLNANSGFYFKNNNSLTLSEEVSGTGNLSVDGDFGASARLVLSGSNTFSGDVLLQSDGKLTVANVDALANATLQASGQRVSVNLTPNNLAYNIGGLKGNSLDINLGTAGGAGGKVSIGSNHQSNTFTGALSSTGAGLIKKGTGTQTMVKIACTGNTIIEAGNLTLSKASALSYSAATVGQDTGRAAGNQSYLTVSSTAGLAVGQTITDAFMPANTTIVAIESTTRVILSNTVTNGTYTGTINAMDGSIASSPVIEIQSGATLDVSTLSSAFPVSSTQTLGGAGTVSGPISVSGKLSPGMGESALDTTIGTLTTGNAAFDATGEYVCNIIGSGSDLLAAGTLTVDAAAKLTLSGTPTVSSYTIATYTGAAPTQFVASGVPSGYHLDYTEAGKIKLVADGGGTPFDTWAAGAPNNLTGPDALPGADPDKDGMKNIAEFALGGNPNSGSDNGASLAKVQDVSGNPALTLTFLTRSGTTFAIGSGPRTATQDGVTYSVQGGQNLSDWSADITEVVPAITSGMATVPSGYEYHTFKTAGPVSTTTKDFLRVQVVGQ